MLRALSLLWPGAATSPSVVRDSACKVLGNGLNGQANSTFGKFSA